MRTEAAMERRRRKDRERHRQNQALYTERHRQWVMNNPEKVGQYRQKNRAKFNAASKRFRETAKFKEWRRQYRNQNREVINAQDRAWKKANLAKSKAIHKKSRLKNHRAFLLNLRWWAKANPHKIVDYAARRRARKAITAVNPKLIQEFLGRAKSRRFCICYYCGEKVPSSCIHLEHIISLSKGGPHSIENVCISCGRCNLSKSAKAISEWEKDGQQILPL